MDIKVKDVQGEIREGFYVQPLMKRMWAVQIDILKVIDAICRRHGIKYYGWFGTLLGAVRHHGFIPWDDDMDLAMLRDDYEKFQYFVGSELPDGWQLLKVAPTLIRVLNTNVIRWDQEFLDRSHGCPYVMGVDIFCLDNIPKDKQGERLWMDLFFAVYKLHEYWDDLEENEIGEEKECQLKAIEALTGYHFDEHCSVKEQLYFLADKIAAMYWDTESLEISNVAELYAYPYYRIPRTCFDKSVEVPFEDIKIPILKDHDLICRLSYGNGYMTPIKNALHSDVKFQIDSLRDHFRSQGRRFPEYFDMTFDRP